VQIAVHDLGAPEDPAAEVLVFSHATGFHGRVWQPLAAQLRHRYHCLAVDHRGHGVTETPSDASLAWHHMGRDVMAVLDSGLIPSGRRVHGIGHSMGGAALVLAAAGEPESFRSLWLYEPVIMPPGALPTTQESNPMSDAALRRRETFESLEEARENYGSKPPLNELRSDSLWAYVTGGFSPQAGGGVKLRCAPASEAAVFRGAPSSGAWDVLGDLSVPVAIVAGRHEDFAPVAFAPAIVAALPRGTLIERRHLGHFGPLQDPESIGHDIEAWVEATR
jgi:pimeloyl-ACP methyl ester carboxylesterase